MRDINYINEQKMKNDWLWQQTEKYLYYSYKNQNYILPTLIASFFLIFTKGGFYCVALIIIFDIYLCYKNNRELDNDPATLKKRKAIRGYREKYMNN